MSPRDATPRSRYARSGKTTVLLGRSSATALRDIADFERRTMSDVLADMAKAYVTHVLSEEDRRLLGGLIEARSKYEASPRRG
jgi:hypothetical protein